jgi:hypothetical protein
MAITVDTCGLFDLVTKSSIICDQAKELSGVHVEERAGDLASELRL